MQKSLKGTGIKTKEAILNALWGAENILLLTHVHADGDAIGSAFALAYYLSTLKSAGKICILTEEAPPKDLSFIYDKELPECISFRTVTAADNECPGITYGAAVAIDISDENRLGSRKKLFHAAAVKIRIDHHISDSSAPPFTDITMCDTSWAATAEGIWGLIRPYMKDCKYAREIACCIYAGILTDTGCFAYSNVTSRTHKIAAELIKTAGNMSWQYSAIYENISKTEIALRKLAYEKIKYYENGRIAFLAITKEDMASAGACDDNLQSFAPFLRCIENVNVGIFAKPDIAGGFRISLRSDASCDVAAVAALFGGGGHKRAAGLTYKTGAESFPDFVKRLIGETVKWMV